MVTIIFIVKVVIDVIKVVKAVIIDFIVKENNILYEIFKVLK